MEDAVTMYTLICKRMLRLQSALVNDGGDYKKCVKNFPDAVQYLCSGYPTESGNLLIAWSLQAITDFSTLDTVPIAIVRSSKHAAFTTMGQQDRFGRVHQITRIMQRGRPTNQWNMQGANSSTQRVRAAYTLTRPQ
ncbi:hypothetical protein LRS06_22070 [Hymenobacter sp. J193]|uniref:hypothetical protein n=1 Tax=Hymenobacter sp. J193 TaxID=2898429 RepID=UPI002150BA9C|nr:hypothetical protein [Hymenobacter sp. J193]MCR5890417.1 hypothetical protein [Hymenobacter sp. J193]